MPSSDNVKASWTVEKCSALGFGIGHGEIVASTYNEECEAGPGLACLMGVQVQRVLKWKMKASSGAANRVRYWMSL